MWRSLKTRFGIILFFMWQKTVTNLTDSLQYFTGYLLPQQKKIKRGVSQELICGNCVSKFNHFSQKWKRSPGAGERKMGFRPIYGAIILSIMKQHWRLSEHALLALLFEENRFPCSGFGCGPSLFSNISSQRSSVSVCLLPGRESSSMHH